MAAASNMKKRRDLIEKSIHGFANTMSISDSLSFLSEVCIKTKAHHKSKKKSEAIKISAESAAILRRIFVQGLHGAAPEATRDPTLIHLFILLDHADYFHSSWLIESAYDTKIGSFLMAICSVLSVEIHLGVQELFCLYESWEPNTTAQDHESRKERLSMMLPLCFSLFSKVYDLLAASCIDEETSSADDQAQVIGYAVLLEIKGVIHTTCNEIFDFIKSSAILVAKYPLIESLIVSGLKALSPWIMEDDALITPFLQILAPLMQLSRVPTDLEQQYGDVASRKLCLDKSVGYLFQSDSTVSDDDALVRQSSQYMAKNKLVGSIQAYWKNYLHEYSLNNDILVYLLPIILSRSAELDEDQAEMITFAPSIITRSLCLLTLLCQGAYSILDFNYHSSQSLSETPLFDPSSYIYATTMSIDLFTSIMQFYAKDLKQATTKLTSSSKILDISFEELSRNEYFGARDILLEAFSCVLSAYQQAILSSLECIRRLYILVSSVHENQERLGMLLSSMMNEEVFLQLKSSLGDCFVLVQDILLSDTN
jgi:hypothetical protein